MAFDQLLPPGTASYKIEVRMLDSSTGNGKTGLAVGAVTCYYIRRGAAANVLVSLQAMTLGTWLSGGWVEVDPTNQRGLYQFGIPNAAIVAGADAVTITFQAAGALDKAVNIALDGRNQGGVSLS